MWDFGVKKKAGQLTGFSFNQIYKQFYTSHST